MWGLLWCLGRLCLGDFGAGFLTFLSWVFLGFCGGWVLCLAVCGVCGLVYCVLAADWSAGLIC